MGWERLFRQLQKDLKLWLFGVAFLEAFRLVFIAAFHAKLGEGFSAAGLAGALLNGFRYDSRAMIIWVAVPVLFSILCAFRDWERLADRVRLGFAVAFLVLSLFLCRVAVGYFEEYDNHFDERMFGLVYDDAGAVMITIWKEHHVILWMLLLAGLAVAGAFALRRYLRNPILKDELARRLLGTTPRRISAAVLAALLVFVAARGSVSRRPVQLKDAAITRDELLNKSVVNPYMALHYTWSAHRRLLRSRGLEVFLPDRNIRAAARLATGRAEDLPDLDAYLLRHAAGSPNPAPRHVFLVVMESYSAWPTLPRFEPLGLTKELSALARDGVSFPAFVASSEGTMSCLDSILLGLPYTVPVNYQPSARKAYPFSLAAIFKRLGYRTRFFYGGYLSWQNCGQHFRDQGFEEVYGGADMGTWKEADEWGAPDEAIFDLAARTVADEPPSFNLIMTTSNHPPFPIDVAAKGFPLKAVPAELAKDFDGSMPLKAMGHLWYSDRCLGNFVRRVEARKVPALFAVTGDHYGRRYINARPSFFERSAVPFVLYGREALAARAAPPGTVGGQMDIAPTLVELCAPAGFEYQALGRDLLAGGGRNLGVGSERVLGPDFIADLEHGQVHPLSLPGVALPEKPPDLGELRRYCNAVHAVAWWRIMRGAELPRK